MKNGFLFATALMLVCWRAGFAASFQGLGDLPGGNTYSQALGISADGSVVVGYGYSASGGEAFRWTSDGGMVGLGDLPGDPCQSEAVGVSADGSVVVGDSHSVSGYEAFRWTSGGGMVGLGDLAGGEFLSFAKGISADGSVVVGYSSSALDHEAFRWTSDGGMVGLGDLPGDPCYSEAWGVSADGSVVVGQGNSASGYEAFRWTSGGGMVGLGDLPGSNFYSYATGVSADGLVVVGASNSASGPEAFRWTSGGGMVGLGDLAGGDFYSYATGVSADGSVVVGGSKSALGTEAFYWTASGGMRSLKDLLTNDYGLDLTGWTLSVATGVSADGLTIVGWGVNPVGNPEAWRATIPEFADMKVDGPTILPNGGTFDSPQQVTLSCSTADATIRYTTDGSDPNASSTLYSSPFTVSSSCTVKARGFKSGYTDSDVGTASFIISVAHASRKFGSFDGKKNVKLILQDCNNNDVTFSLTGGGYGEIDPNDCGFSEISLFDTTEKSILTIKTKGNVGTSVGSIICNGPLKGISAKTIDISGSIEIGSPILPNPKASVTLAFDQSSGLAINSEMPIKALTAAEWIGGAIDAPAISSIIIKGDKKRMIPGDLDIGVTAGGVINSVKVAGELSGVWDCSIVKSITAAKMNGTDLTLNWQLDAKIPALRKLAVKGWVAYSRILSTGNIGTITAGGITESTCFAGITDTNDSDGDGVLDLPDPDADIDYNAPATIKSIAIKGIKGYDDYCVYNSNIAAANILSVSFAYPQNDNEGVPFGVAADYIKKLTIKDATGSEVLKELNQQSDFDTLNLDLGDAEIRLH